MENFFGLFYLLSIFIGAYFNSKLEELIEEKHFSSWWMTIGAVSLYVIPILPIVLWAIVKYSNDHIKFEEPE